MYIIDKTYFTREFSVPNINELDSRTSVLLDQYIDEKCPLLLQNALGVLFKDFDSYVTDGELANDAPEKWQKLLTGASYTDKEGNEKIWNGLIYEYGTFKVSVFQPYVFYYFLRENSSFLSSIGEVLASAKNAINVSSGTRIVDSWNKFHDLYQKGYEPKNYSQDFRLVRYDNRLNNIREEKEVETYVSLLTFLYDNEVDYPGAKLKTFKKQNIFSI